MTRAKLRVVQLMAGLALSGIIAGHACAETLNVDAWAKSIDKIGKKLLCICHDGSEFQDYGGYVSSAGYITPPGAVQVACIIPQFQDPQGGHDQTGDTACYTYTVLN